MAFVEPAKIVPYFGLGTNMLVADFGAGAGDYALAMSQAVLPNGKVYALDVQKDVLRRLKNTAESRHISNLEYLWADMEEPGGAKIADQLVDFVLLSNVLFQATSPYKMLVEAKRILKPGGRLAIIDWQDSFGQLGPTAQQIITEEKARQIVTEAGLSAGQSFPAGDHHYGFLTQK